MTVHLRCETYWNITVAILSVFFILRVLFGNRSVYVTKYRIDHEAEIKGLWRGVALHQCIPCSTCDTMGKQERLVGWIWYFLASKLLIFTARLCTIIFGIVKVWCRQCLVKMVNKSLIKQKTPKEFTLQILCTVYTREAITCR